MNNACSVADYASEHPAFAAEYIDRLHGSADSLLARHEARARMPRSTERWSDWSLLHSLVVEACHESRGYLSTGEGDKVGVAVRTAEMALTSLKQLARRTGLRMDEVTA